MRWKMYFKVITKIFLEIGGKNLETESTQTIPGKINNCERIIEIITKLLNSEVKEKFFKYFVHKKKEVMRTKKLSPASNLHRKM